MIYCVEEDLYILGFVDSDFLGDVVDRKVTTGYFFQVAKEAIFWRCKKSSLCRPGR